METVQAGTWVPLQEAAIRLGLSVDSARKKAQRGTLLARKVPRAQGHVWEIHLDAIQVPEPEHGPPSSSDPAGSSWDPAALSTAVLELTRENRRLAEQNIQLAGQVGYLQAQLQAEREKVAQLEAPRTLEISNVAERAPWWRFWARRTAEASI